MLTYSQAAMLSGDRNDVDAPCSVFAKRIVLVEDSSVMRTIHVPGRSALVQNVSVRVDVYVEEGCKAKLTMHPGAIQAFDRAIIVGPSFALAHTAKPHAAA